MIKFWKWLREYATNKIAKLSGAGVRCPNCKLWHYERPDDFWSNTAFHNSDIVNLDVPPDKLVEHCTCGQCGFRSNWRFDLLPFGLGMQTDERGTPLEK